MDDDSGPISEIHVFNIIGTYAHFRKFYTNSSSLSYHIPPRTIIAGIIAGMFGLPSERFSIMRKNIYYEKFSRDNCIISVAMKTPVRKMMQTVNYYNPIKQNKSFRYQIPLEILRAKFCKEIKYRIFFSFHKPQAIQNYSEKIERIRDNRFIYPPYLGLTEFIASIKYVDTGKIRAVTNTNILHSACRLSFIKDINPDNNSRYLSERMPVGFTNDRTPLPPEDYLIEVDGNPIHATFREDAILFEVTYRDNGEEIREFISPM